MGIISKGVRFLSNHSNSAHKAVSHRKKGHRVIASSWLRDFLAGISFLTFRIFQSWSKQNNSYILFSTRLTDTSEVVAGIICMDCAIIMIVVYRALSKIGQRMNEHRMNKKKLRRPIGKTRYPQIKQPLSSPLSNLPHTREKPQHPKLRAPASARDVGAATASSLPTSWNFIAKSSVFAIP